MTSCDVVFALTGDVRHNSRALKQLRVLINMRLSVTVIALGTATSLPFLDVRLRSIPRPAGRGPLFFWKVHRKMRKAAEAIPARVYHASDLYCLAALSRAAAFHGGKVAYDARELYPHVASTVGRPWARLYWNQVERRAIRHAQAVFTVSDSIATRMRRTRSVPRPLVLHNVPEIQEVLPAGSLRTLASVDPDSVLILHQGSIQKGRGCFRLVAAMKEVTGATLVFMGGGPLKPALVAMVQAQELGQRVKFVPPVLPEVLLPITADADLGVTMLKNNCLNHRYALPNKLFEYLMAGIPVLGSDTEEVRRVVQFHNVGQVVDGKDRVALAKALQECVDRADLRRTWRANTRTVFESYNWSTAASRFAAGYMKILA